MVFVIVRTRTTRQTADIIEVHVSFVLCQLKHTSTGNDSRLFARNKCAEASETRANTRNTDSLHAADMYTT